MVVTRQGHTRDVWNPSGENHHAEQVSMAMRTLRSNESKICCQHVAENWCTASVEKKSASDPLQKSDPIERQFRTALCPCLVVGDEAVVGQLVGPE